MEQLVLTEIKRSHLLNIRSLVKASQMPSEQLYENIKEIAEQNPLFMGPIGS